MKIKSLLLLTSLVALPLGNAVAVPPGKAPVAKKKVDANKGVNAQFELARKHFASGELALSAAAVRAAASQISVNTAAGDPSLKAPSVEAIATLNTLATNVEAGKVKDATVLDAKFASVSNLMARYHHSVAEAALAKNDNKAAGAAFGRTADYLENRARWSGEKLGDAGKATVAGLRNMSGALLNATGTVVKGAGTVLGKGFGLITGAGRAITGQPKPAESKPNPIEKIGEGIKKTGDKVEAKKSEAVAPQ